MLYAIPLIFVRVGLALYGVLGGADFGAGFWQLVSGSDERSRRIRELAHDSMAPVWEANHVWLIFVLTVTWTCYPKFFGSAASTLCVALSVAAVGIVFRGAAYALRTGTSARHEQRLFDSVLGGSSVLAPFALGAAIGGIAAGRVPVGNAAGSLFSSWLNPVSILIGALAVATGAYLAAVFLCGDAMRRSEPELAEAFRTRALGAGVVAGAIAVGGIIVLHADAHPLYHGLVEGNGLAGFDRLGCGRHRDHRARLGAAVRARPVHGGGGGGGDRGWLGAGPEPAPAPRPERAPGRRLARHSGRGAGGRRSRRRAPLPLAGHAVPTRPRGRLTEGATADEAISGSTPLPRSGWLVRAAIALLIARIGLVNVADAEWAHLVGAACFLACIVTAFRAAVPLARGPAFGRHPWGRVPRPDQIAWKVTVTGPRFHPARRPGATRP